MVDGSNITVPATDDNIKVYLRQGSWWGNAREYLNEMKPPWIFCREGVVNSLSEIKGTDEGHGVWLNGKIELENVNGEDIYFLIGLNDDQNINLTT